MINAPSLFKPMICALLASGCFVAARGFKLPDWMTLLLVLAGMAFAVCALLYALDWVLFHYAGRLRDIRRAMAITPAIELAHAVRGLTPYQAELLEKHQLELQAIVGDREPIYLLRAHGTDIPLAWVEEYLAEASKLYPKLPPVRTYSDGSHSRDYARAFTSLVVSVGMASPSAGNQAATWRIPLAEVERRVGLV